MRPDFAGSTAEYYRRYRRDVPDAVVDLLCEAFMLSRADRVLDVGCGTGQLTVPLSRRVGDVVAVDPEPDMLAQLDARLDREGIDNATTVPGADSDIAALLRVPPVGHASGTGPFAAVTVATALHWMDAEDVFRTCHDLLRPGGGVAVISQGLPLWLQDSDWSRALRSYLQNWAGPLSSTCGTDLDTLEQRRLLMTHVGFAAVRTSVFTDRVAVDVDYVIGNLYSAMSHDQLAQADRPRFERGLRQALDDYLDPSGVLVDALQTTLLVGRV